MSRDDKSRALLERKLYEQLHNGVSGDVEFYIDAAREADSVLELWCGAGRICGRIASASCRVTGLDQDPHALELLPDQVTPVLGDMSDFSIDAEFDLIIIPFNSLLCLADEQRVVGCFRAARKHLSQNGRLLFDVYSADGFHQAAHSGLLDASGVEPWQLLERVQVDDTEFDVLERSVIRLQSQRVDAQYWFRAKHCPELSFRSSIVQRYLLVAEIEPLLTRAGMQMVSMCGGFAREPLTAESEVIVVEARAGSEPGE